MEDVKKQFIFRHIPASIPFLDLPIPETSSLPKGVLQVDTQRNQEIVVLAILPTEAHLKMLREQKNLPSNISFEATKFIVIKNALGVQGGQAVIAMVINTTPYRTSPYMPWFAAYPRAIALYVGIVALFGTALYFSS